MKNTLSILFAALILISGMHPAVSTHFCCGKVAAVKWSFSGENASCGMSDSGTSSFETIVRAQCCENEKSVLSTDENYAPSIFQFDLTPELSSIILCLTSNVFASDVSVTSSYFYSGSPPGDTKAGLTSLSGLCTFRI